MSLQKRTTKRTNLNELFFQKRKVFFLKAIQATFISNCQDKFLVAECVLDKVIS